MSAPALRVIPRSDYLRLDALLVQSRQLRQELERLRAAAHAITGEAVGGLTDQALLHFSARDTVALLQCLRIRIAEPAPWVDGELSASHVISSLPCSRSGNDADAGQITAPVRTIFSLDQAGRPHVIEVHAHLISRGRGPAESDETFALTDGTPVELIAPGRYRTTGVPPQVDLYTAESDPRTTPPAPALLPDGKSSWSSTDTAPAGVRKPESLR